MDTKKHLDTMEIQVLKSFNSGCMGLGYLNNTGIRGYIVVLVVIFVVITRSDLFI